MEVLPRTDANANLEQAALDHLSLLATNTKGALLRLITGRDIGQDGLLEFAEPGEAGGSRSWRNNCVAVQSKGSRARTRGDGAKMFRLEVKNLNYLASIPALYWAWDAETECGFLRWRDDIVRELDQRLSGWRTKTEVSVPFFDVATEQRLLAFGEDARARYARWRAVAPATGVVRDFLAGRLPPHLRARSEVIGRAVATKQIRLQIRPRALIRVVGPPGSGKTDLVRHALEEPAVRTAIDSRFDKPVDLLYLEPDARVGERPLLRSLWNALDEPVPYTFDENADDLTTVEEQKARMLLENLPRRLAGARQVLVIDGFDDANRSPADTADAEELLRHADLVDGLAIATSWTPPSIGARGIRILAAPIEIGPLDRDAATAVLVRSGADLATARAAVDAAAEVQGLLYPDVVERAANLYASQAGSDRDGNDSDTLATCLLDASGLWARDALDRLLGAGRLLREPRVIDLMVAWALVGQRSPTTALEQYGLAPEIQERLGGMGWLAVENGIAELADDLRRGLRAEFLRWMTSDSTGPGEVPAISARILRDLASGPTGIDADALEAGLAWLRRSEVACPDLEAVLLEWLVVLSADQPVLPFGQEDRERAASSSALSAPQVVASAVFASLFGDDAQAFAEEVERAAAGLSEREAVSAAELRALDTAAFFGSRRLRAEPLLLSARERLTRHLAEGEVLASLVPSALKWAVSWSLNTAHVAINLGRPDVANDSVETAWELLQRMPEPNAGYVHVDQQALWSRFRQAEARLASDPKDRLKALRRAAWHAHDILSFDQRERWVSFYQRACGRILNEEGDDDARAAVVDTAHDVVARALGSPEGWPPPVASRHARLMLQVARYGVDPELQAEQAGRARDFLKARTADLGAWLRGGVGEPMLQLARCHELLAYLHHLMDDPREYRRETEAALRCAEAVVQHCPSPAAWLFLLKTSDRDDGRVGGLQRRRELGSRTDLFLRRAEEWLSEEPAGDIRNAGLALWIVERRWRVQGSIMRVGRGLPSWETDDDRTKRNTLGRLRAKRLVQLRDLEQRYGLAWTLMGARIRLERQYQWSAALYKPKNAYDAEAVLSLYEEARERWPDRASVLLGRAEYYRFIWALDEARNDLRKVIASATHGNMRRRAAVLLARVLVDGAAYASLPEAPAELLEEARAAVEDTGGFRLLMYERALLAERIAFESGEDLDWARVDEVYDEVVGGIDRYPATVVANLDELREGRLDAADDFASVVKRRYSDARALRDLGSLYLRRTTKLDTKIEDAERAFACYDAARIVRQRAEVERGDGVLLFLRASAILAGARAAGSATPFAVGQRANETALDMASRDLSRVQSRTVGDFRELARQRQGEVDRARRAAQPEDANEVAP